RSENGQPLQSTLTSGGHMPIYVNPSSQPNASMTYGQPPGYPFCTQGGNPSLGGTFAYHPYGGYTQPAKKFTKTHLAVHNIKQRDGESTRAFVTRYTDDTLRIMGLHEEQRISSFVHGLKTKSLVEFLSIDLPTSYEILMEKTYTWIEAKKVATNGAPSDHKEGFDRFNKGFSWDNSKGKKKNQDRAEKSDRRSCKVRATSHLVKGIKKERQKLLTPNSVNGKRRQGYLPVEAPILMPSIRSLRVDSKIPLVGFLGEHSWPLGEVPLEVTMGKSPHTRTETLNFVIISQAKEAWIGFGKKQSNLQRSGRTCKSMNLARSQISDVGFRLKCFLDAYKGYHQIQMAEGDEGKTSFFTRKGVFGYQKMPFGLKNVGATYQRLVNKVFNDQIGRNLEVYVDDMGIKSASEEDMLMDIQKTFDMLRSINMKLNLKKCSFDIEEEDKDTKIKKPKVANKAPKSKSTWKLYIDGAFNSNGSGVGLMLVSPKGKEYTYALRLPASGQPSKGSFRSQKSRNKAIHRKDERSLEKLRYLLNGAHSKESEQDGRRTNMGIRHLKANTPRGAPCDETRVEVTSD
nr:reverse transcriptase domain-containing protein [Tanacetum cinerariifolium]